MDKELDSLLIDTVMERPAVFKVSGDIMYIYPLTLGKTFLLQRAMEQMKMSPQNIQRNFNIEVLRVVSEKRDVVCELLAYMTARNDYYSVFDVKSFERRKEILMSLEDSDIGAMLIVVLTLDKTKAFIRHLKIDDEQKYMSKVMKVKNKSDKNTYNFGGVSIYGSLIDSAMERYKMSKREVVWEIDYTSLRLLLADRVNSVYVTDEERGKIKVPHDRTRINGDNKEEIKRAIASETWL